mgnify:FL=1
MSLVDIDWSAASRLKDWARSRYLLLVKEIGAKEFTTKDVEEVLQRGNMALENVNKLLSVLRREGLVKVRENPRDFRRSIYQLVLVQPRAVPARKAAVGRNELIKLLKSGADLIRTAVDYKVLLLFLFYKTVSDKWHSIVDGYIKEGFSREEAYLLANSDYLVLYDEREGRLYSWREITRSRETIKEIANAIIRIARLNEGLQDLQKLVEVLGFLGFISEDNMHILEGLVQLFNQYDFSEVDYDAIGDAYQWVLSYFAPEKAKEGETYTPREVIKLIVRILDVKDGSVILDPACGSGAMLIEAYNYVREKLNGGKPSLELFGQERNEIMAVIAKMNLLLHGIGGYEVFVGDSLTNPRFEHADYVIANPPWNQDGYSESNLGEPSVRRIYTCFGVSGFTPKNTADWAWIQLMTYYANRKVGIVLDNGALFRGGREKNIRRAAVEKDLIEAVILLPEKLFYNTGAPGIILILNKNKPEERKRKILFINASQEYESHPEIRRLNIISEKNIKNIVDAYRRFEDVEGFARVVSVDEIRENNYNLNVTLYVYPKIEEEEIDLVAELKEFERIEAEEKEAVSKAINYVKEILEAS